MKKLNLENASYRYLEQSFKEWLDVQGYAASTDKPADVADCTTDSPATFGSWPQIFRLEIFRLLLNRRVAPGRPVTRGLLPSG